MQGWVLGLALTNWTHGTASFGGRAFYPDAPSLRVCLMQGWVLGLALKNWIHGTAPLGGGAF
jgi:hypothetical protein